ncbi:hypothetical protein C1X73_33990, partial [Pseudomonas sp. FW305-130]
TKGDARLARDAGVTSCASTRTALLWWSAERAAFGETAAASVGGATVASRPFRKAASVWTRGPIDAAWALAAEAPIVATGDAWLSALPTVKDDVGSNVRPS